MNVLIVTGLFYPSTLGGPCRSLYWLALALKEKNIKVTVITSSNSICDNSIPFDSWTDVDGLQVFYASTKHKLCHQVQKHTKNNDSVILSSICYLPSSFAAFIAAISHKQIIWAPRGELFNSAINGSFAKKSYFRLLRCLFGKRVVWQATSNEEKQLIFQFFGSKATVRILPNYMVLPQKEQRCEPITIPYFLYVGRIAPIKALDNVIRAFSLSKSFAKSDYKLYFAGGVQEQFKSYYSELKLLVSQFNLEDKIVFLGHIDGKDKNQLYANAYMTLLLSHSENFGNVVIESLSQSTPVIASKGTPWQILNESNAGFWIDNDPQCIANSIDEAINLSTDKYSEYRMNAGFLSEQFDIDKNVDKWVEVFKISSNIGSRK